MENVVTSCLFKELRYDQLNRPQEYWDSFEKGIQKIIKSLQVLGKLIFYNRDKTT